MTGAVKEIFAETAYDSFEFRDTVEDSPRRDSDVATAGNVLKSRPGNNFPGKVEWKKGRAFRKLDTRDKDARKGNSSKQRKEAEPEKAERPPNFLNGSGGPVQKVLRGSCAPRARYRARKPSSSRDPDKETTAETVVVVYLWCSSIFKLCSGSHEQGDSFSLFRISAPSSAISPNVDR